MPSEPASLPSIFGPYEHWLLGNNGRPYTEFSYQNGANLGGIVEMPVGSLGGATNGSGDIRLPQASAGSPASPLGIPDEMLAPALWNAGLQAIGAESSLFLPCVAMYRARPESFLSGARSGYFRLTKALAHGHQDLAETPEAKAEHGYRFNSPLPAENLNPGYKAERIKLVPNAALAKQIGKEKGTLKPGRSPLVIMAVIDDGLPFAHPHLRDADGASRVECCWLQSANAQPQIHPVLFGRELLRGDIDRLITAHRGCETDVYRAAGSLREGAWSPLAQSVTHGGFVLDIAAGHRQQASPVAARERPVAKSGNLDRMRVIGVELPPAAVIDTAGFGKEFYCLSAFHYVLRRADEITKAYGLEPEDVPLIINFSFGFSGGPHDGQDRLESAIAQLIRQSNAFGRPTRLVMPSGNEFLSGLYGEIGKDTADAIVPWRISPNDRTSSYLEIWYPPNAKKGRATQQPKRLILTAPDGETTDVTFPDLALAELGEAAPQSIHAISSGGRVIGQASLDFHRSYRWRVMVILAPTEVRDAGLMPAPAGLWKIKVDTKPLKGKDVICCRIQRDNGTFNPWQGGRQSYFDHPGDRLFDAEGALAQTDAGAVFVRRFGTLNGLATHDQVVVVAGYDKATGKAASYSSAGLVAPTSLFPAHVSCAAPSNDSPALRGRRSAGSRAASVGRLVGTSAAAPTVARHLAIEMLDGKGALPAPLPVASTATARLGAHMVVA